MDHHATLSTDKRRGGEDNRHREKPPPGRVPGLGGDRRDCHRCPLGGGWNGDGKCDPLD